jgi:hypothetical protein
VSVRVATDCDALQNKATLERWGLRVGRHGTVFDGYKSDGCTCSLVVPVL